MAANSDYALISDISEPTRNLYKETQKTLLVAKNRFDFLNKMINLFEKESDKFYRTSVYSTEKQSNDIRSELFNPESWLGNDGSFEKIQSMWKEGKIEFIRLDICDADNMEKIFKWIQSNELELASLYVSNIGDQIAPFGRKELEKMQNSLKKIIQDNTFVIDATTKDIIGEQNTIEPQMIFLGKIYTPSLIREDKLKS